MADSRPRSTFSLSFPLSRDSDSSLGDRPDSRRALLPIVKENSIKGLSLRQVAHLHRGTCHHTQAAL